MPRLSHRLGLGKAPRVLLEPFQAEQFRTDGMAVAREFASENHGKIEKLRQGDNPFAAQKVP
jgi:hypothetical protein